MGAATHCGRGCAHHGALSTRENDQEWGARREMHTTRRRAPGFWVGAKTRRHKGGGAKLDERVGSGCGNRPGYQLTV
jgi:hypothetical protein